MLFEFFLRELFGILVGRLADEGRIRGKGGELEKQTFRRKSKVFFDATLR